MPVQVLQATRLLLWPPAIFVQAVWCNCHASPHPTAQNKGRVNWTDGNSPRSWKPAARVRVKIKNVINELHNQSINFLTKNYSTILIPAFETSQMVSKKAGRKIRTKTARAMMTCSHYLFRTKLQNKAQENGCTVKVVTEEYTSKTASWTGEIVNVGSSKKITSQGVTLDRDLNGARGIFLKALVDSPDLRNKVASVSFC